MSGTPPLGPAALSRVLVRTLPARRARALLLLALAATAAVALAAPPARAQAPAACASAIHPLGAASTAAVQDAVRCRVNEERAARGLVAVAPSEMLDAVAQRHAGDMVTRRYFAHVSPSGGTVDKRARRAGYLTAPCWILGEDLGWAPPDAASADAVVTAWMLSPSHRAVILDPAFREIGVGLAGRAPVGPGTGATFVLEVGAMLPCAGPPGGTIRAAPRARIRLS